MSDAMLASVSVNVRLFGPLRHIACFTLGMQVYLRGTGMFVHLSFYCYMVSAWPLAWSAVHVKCHAGVSVCQCQVVWSTKTYSSPYLGHAGLPVQYGHVCAFEFLLSHGLNVAFDLVKCQAGISVCQC